MLASWPVLAVTFYNFVSAGDFWSSIWLLRFYYISNHIYGLFVFLEKEEKNQSMLTVCGSVHRGKPLVSFRRAFSIFLFITL